MRRTTGGRVSCSLSLLTPAQKVCQIFLQQTVSKSQFELENVPRLNDIRTCWDELASEALSAAKLAKLPAPVAVQNVVFEQHANGIVHFSSSALQIVISSSPRDARLRDSLDFCFISPADLLSAHSSAKQVVGSPL